MITRALLTIFALVGVCSGAAAQKVMPMNSTSMAPTFAEGAPLKINLFAYAFSSPTRWDVITYRSADGKHFLTKRIVGLPGDVVAYDSDKNLKINGVTVTRTSTSFDARWEEQTFVEALSDERHLIQLRDGAPAVIEAAVESFRGRERCTYAQGGFSCTVPPNHVFVMGDNRDSSRDSRYQGFVPVEDVGGRVENVPAVPAGPLKPPARTTR